MDVPESSQDLGSEAARDAVAAIVERADEREKAKAEAQAEHVERGPAKPFLARPAVVGALMVVFVAILAVDVYVLTRPPVPPTTVELESSARIETAVAALKIETFKEENGRYPESLAEAGIQLTGIEYTRTTQGYRLRSRPEAAQDPEALPVQNPPRVDHQAGDDVEALVSAIPNVGGAS